MPPKYLETAEFIGAKLTRDAIWAGDRCNWFGSTVTELRASIPVVSHRMCGPDYYSGTSGIAIFLARLYAATGERLLRLTAVGAIRQALSRLDDVPPGQRLTFYSGLIGIAYALLELARACSVEKFNDLALFILEEISNDDLEHESLGLDSGTIPALLKIYRDHPKEFLLQTAVRLGECLINVEREGNYDSEQSSSIFNGTTNLPQALLELFHATGQEKFKHAAEEWFLSDQKSSVAVANDHDVASENSRSKRKLATTNDSAQRINGSVAGSFTRLRAFEILHDEVYLVETGSALLDITENLARSLTEHDMNFSLGRGLAGQADVLIEADRILQVVNYRVAAETIGAWGIDQYRNDNLPWPCDSPGSVETPGLITGLAGIGYLYLRLHNPLQEPSLLMFSS